MSFNNLKRSRGNNISKLVEAVEAQTTDKKGFKDEKEWKASVDKSGNGYAVMRFLPAAEGFDMPWERYWDHGFKGPTGQWYIERSLTSIGQADPLGEANSKLWATDIKENQEIVRTRKRRLHYVSNVLIVLDSANPENEGKVFKYVYGKKIHDKIMEAMRPEFQDEKPLDPFDMWDGADFKLKIRQVEGYRNYDKSEFATQSSISESDDELEALYGKIHDLSEYSDPKGFKSYKELSDRLALVLGEKAPAQEPRADLSRSEETPVEKSATPPKIAESAADEGDDDTMAYFAKLAAEQ